MKTVSQLPKPSRPLLPNVPKLYCCLRSLREKHRLSLRDVAKHSSVSTATLSRMEYGAECELTQALKLANFFETTVEKIWDLKA